MVPPGLGRRRDAAAAEALGAARDRGDSFVLPASAYAEIVVRPAAEGPATVARVDATLDGLAIAVELDADHLLTTDQRWKTLRRLGLRGRLTVVG